MKDITEALGHGLRELKKTENILEYSYRKCREIGIESGPDNDQLESLKALTSRFARLSDIVILKL